MKRIETLLIVLLSAWLALTPYMWFAATRSFRTVDRVLAQVDSGFEAAVKPMGAEQTRQVLRYAASEINATLFRAYSIAQMALGVAVILLLLRARPRDNLSTALAGAMFVLVLSLALVIQPQIVSLGRKIAFGTPAPAATSRFWKLHGAFTALDSVKLLAGLVLLGRRMVRR